MGEMYRKFSTVTSMFCQNYWRQNKKKIKKKLEDRQLTSVAAASFEFHSDENN
jgi:hypothetical protein